MSRKEVKVRIKMRPSGGIFICPDVNGDIIIYEDQITNIMTALGKCRTRGDAVEIINDFSRGLDLHHSSVKVPTIRKKVTLQSRAKMTVEQAKPAPVKPATMPKSVQGTLIKDLPSESQVRIMQAPQQNLLDIG